MNKSNFGWRLVATAFFTGSIALASAQTYSSFNAATGIYGVHVSNVGLTYTITCDPVAYLVINNTHYDITDIFGFWNVSGTNALNGSGVDQQSWNWNEHSTGGGYIAGWTNNPKNNDIQPGGQLSLTYSGLTQANSEGYGFHFSLAQNFSGSNTAYFRGPLISTPEPASFVCLGLGGLVLLRRRASARN